METVEDDSFENRVENVEEERTDSYEQVTRQVGACYVKCFITFSTYKSFSLLTLLT